MARKKDFDQEEYITAVENLFRKNGTRERAEGAKAYMRGLFDYYGLSTPARRELEKKFHAQNPLPDFSQSEEITKKLWNKPQCELQYFAMELLYRHRKDLPKASIRLFEYMIRNKSWWDTIDFISPKLLASYFALYPNMLKPKTNEWISSNHIWLMRSALIFQNLHKKKTDEKCYMN